MSIPEHLRCPKCAVDDIAEIVYGPVAMTAELMAQIQSGEVVVRNEPRPENAPRYYCNYCGYEW